MFGILGQQQRRQSRASNRSTSSRISTDSLQSILERLLMKQNRQSTNKAYLGIWRQFNSFLIKLDRKPESWEERVTLFVSYKIDGGAQSSTIKSYVSAIKRILTDDGYKWDATKIMLTSLTKACRMVNDKVYTRLPIQFGLFEVILLELERMFTDQIYLETLYKAMFVFSYYGLMRVGEITDSEHVLKAGNVHSAVNKGKILIVLYSSKTHDVNMHPQKIKLTAMEHDKDSIYCNSRHFCPFELTKNYLRIRGNFDQALDQFFIYSDGSPVLAKNVQLLLKSLISRLGLNANLYGMHSFRIGRTSDLIHKLHYTIEEAKQAGRWRSDAVFRYIRD